MTEPTQPQLAARQFGDTAANYLTSSVHAQGADLDRLEQLARRLQPARALDLGCGAGHTAFALARGGAREVIACDPSPPMLAVVADEARARDLGVIQCRRGTAERLEFDDGSFDLVTTRFSAHHWPSVPAALREVARVLKPRGRFVVIDVIAPEPALLDTTLQTLELLRDLSHVRDYRESEWQQMLAAAGFADLISHRWKLPLQFDSWVRRIATPNRRIEALRVVLEDLPSEARRYYAVQADGSFTSDGCWIEAIRP